MKQYVCDRCGEKMSETRQKITIDSLPIGVFNSKSCERPFTQFSIQDHKVYHLCIDCYYEYLIVFLGDEVLTDE